MGKGLAVNNIEKCLVLSYAHLTQEDNDRFYWFSRHLGKWDGVWV